MTFKRKKSNINLAGFGIPLLTIAASLGGVYMGQRMVAEAESNKVIREKLALADALRLSAPAGSRHRLSRHSHATRYYYRLTVQLLTVRLGKGWVFED